MKKAALILGMAEVCHSTCGVRTPKNVFAQVRDCDPYCFSNLRETKTCVSTRQNRCCSPGDNQDDGNGIIGITPLPDLGSTLCCEINKNDIIDVKDRL